MWIESHQSLLTHRKTGRLARALNISKITTIGHLHAFWWWCMDNAPSGGLSGIDAEDIADAACWEGDPEEFIGALVHAGFVDSDGETLAVHDWHDFAGKLIEKRASDAERKRRSRASAPVRGTSGGHPRDIRVTAQVPNLTEPNRTNNTPKPPANTEPTPTTTPGEGEVMAQEPAGRPTPDAALTLPADIVKRLEGKPPHWPDALRDALIGADIKSTPTRYLLGILRGWEANPSSAPKPPPPPSPPPGSLRPGPVTIRNRAEMAQESAPA